MESVVGDTTKNNEGDGEKKYIVRIMCQKKSLFVEFAENELNIIQFPEKSKKEIYSTDTTK